MATSTSIARQCARWICGTSASRVPDDVVAKAKTCLADMIGVAAQACDLPSSRRAVDFAIAMGGREASLIGSRERASVADAAFANAVMAHGLVQEDMHTPSVAHIGVVVWPSLLALSEHASARGDDLIAAGVAGYQVMGRLGRALMTKELAQPSVPPASSAPSAAPPPAPGLLRLSEDDTVAALALAANTAGGLNEWPRVGGDEMFFHAGHAARNAVTSVLLAKAGARGAETCLDALFSSYGNRARGVRSHSRADWDILEVYHKPAPACNFAQTPAQAALAVLAQSSFAPGRHRARPRQDPFPRRSPIPAAITPGPYRNLLQAKMSIQFVVAATLAAGRLDDAALRDFSRDGAAARLARRVQLETDSEFAAAYPARQGSEVIVTLRSGNSVRARLARISCRSTLKASARGSAAR